MSDTPKNPDEVVIGKRGSMMTSISAAGDGPGEPQKLSVSASAPAAVIAPEGPWLLAAAAETTPISGMPVSEFGPKPVGQKIAAIGFVLAKISGTKRDERLTVVEWRAGGRLGLSEKALVQGFWSSFDGAWKPRLVSFNGRGHLIPVLRLASMRHSLTARWINDAGDKWSGFGHRFSTEHHADMMDLLSDFHASPYPSLAETAVALGLPAFETPEGDIRGRAQANAATIFLSYLRWRVFTGAMTREGATEAAASLYAAAFSKPEADLTTRHLASFLPH